jgi:hypothetical protein
MLDYGSAGCICGAHKGILGAIERYGAVIGFSEVAFDIPDSLVFDNRLPVVKRGRHLGAEIKKAIYEIDTDETCTAHNNN